MLRFNHVQISSFGSIHETVQQCASSNFIVQLITDDGYSIPEASFKIAFNSGEIRFDTLDLDGKRQIVSAPENEGFRITYLDHDDIRYKAFASRLNAAINRRDFEYIISILIMSPHEINMIENHLQRYFNKSIVDDCPNVDSPDENNDFMKSLIARFNSVGFENHRFAPPAESGPYSD